MADDGIISNMIKALWGSSDPAKQPVWSPPPRTDYPSADDVAFARKNDMTYGRPSAGIDTPGQRQGVLPTIKDVMNAHNTDEPWNIKRVPMQQADRDREYAAYLAANRSPVAALGFQRGDNLTTPTDSSTPKLTHGGFFAPDLNKLWYDNRSPSNEIHESTHRGMEMLGNVPTTHGPIFSPEETWVRALMLKHFGPIEQGRGDAGDKQVASGQAVLKANPGRIKELEDAAALEIARRHPMGPN